MAILQNLLDLSAAVKTAHARYREAVAKRTKAEREMAPLVRSIASTADVEYGDHAPRGDFGLPPPRKKGPKTTEAKVVMVEKARATRRKRGTMGKRRREKIRGW